MPKVSAMVLRTKQFLLNRSGGVGKRSPGSACQERCRPCENFHKGYVYESAPASLGASTFPGGHCFENKANCGASILYSMGMAILRVNSVVQVNLKQISAFGLLLLCAVGCQKEEIRAYRVPKEAPPSQMASGPASAADPHGHSPGFLKWKLPEGWKEQGAEQMRAASFKIEAADGRMAQVVAIPLGDNPAMELESVNIWRRAAGLEPLSPDKLAENAQIVPVDGVQGHLYEIAAEPAAGKVKLRTLGVMSVHAATVWIFKMTGDDSLVTEQKPAFLAFLKSVSFHEGMDQQMAEMPARVSTNNKRIPAQADLPKWDAPAHWQAKAPGPMVLASYTVTGDKGSADVSISKFPGEAGGLIQNVNRWRGQLGLAPAGPAEINPGLIALPIGDEKANMVDLNGTWKGKPARMLGAIVPRGGETWFFKLLGDDAVVAAEKDNFTKFIQSAFK